MISGRYSALGLLLLVSPFLALGARATEEPEESRPDVAFTLSKTSRPSSGAPEQWSIEVLADGTLTWMGLSRSSAAERCLPEAGSYRTEIAPPVHEKLAQLAIGSAKEQAPRPAKTDDESERPRRHDPRLSLDLEEGGELRSLLVADATRPKTAELLAELEKVSRTAFDFPVRALRLSTKHEGEVLVAELTSLGAGETSVFLPQEAKNAFFVEREGKRIALAYAERPAQFEVKLKRKAKLTVRLKRPRGGLKPDARVVYDSLIAAHHSTAKPAPVRLVLCAPEK